MLAFFVILVHSTQEFSCFIKCFLCEAGHRREPFPSCVGVLLPLRMVTDVSFQRHCASLRVPRFCSKGRRGVLRILLWPGPPGEDQAGQGERKMGQAGGRVPQTRDYSTIGRCLILVFFVTVTTRP